MVVSFKKAVLPSTSIETRVMFSLSKKLLRAAPRAADG